jgi:hypothetical protein
MGGVSHVAGVIERDLFDREVDLRKQHVEAFADIVVLMIPEGADILLAADRFRD